MADINYSYTGGGMNLQTPAGPGFTSPGGMPDAGPWAALFAKMADRKAQAQKAAGMEERRRFELENARKQEMHDAQMQAMEGGPDPRIHAGMRQGTSHWVKEIPGFGPVSVAPGTFGAHEEMIGGGSNLLEKSAALGLKPGISGVDFTSLWRDAKDFSQSPSDRTRAAAMAKQFGL